MMRQPDAQAASRKSRMRPRELRRSYPHVWLCKYVRDRLNNLKFPIKNIPYGPSQPTDLPQLRGISDFGAASRRQGATHVPVFRM